MARTRITTLVLVFASLAYALRAESAASAGPEAARATGAPRTTGAPARPNIVFLLADDLGWGDVGYHGSEILTPHIDRMAAAGVRLNQFYALQLCSPTRAAFLTGRYPMRFGMQRGQIAEDFDGGLPLDERTLSAAMREAGYRTVICGKWHLGHRKAELRPLARGFQHQYGSYGAGIDYYTHHVAPALQSNGTTDSPLGWYRDEKPLVEEGYATDLIAEEVVRVLDAHDGEQPLFLYVPFTAPHLPLQAPEKNRKLHRFEIRDSKRRRFAGVVNALDDGVGRILAALDRNGMRENTLVVFCSDNGATKSGSNRPLRGGKADLYEGGVRVPAIVLWPGVLDAGVVVDEPLHIVDFFPTLLNLAGGSIEQPLALDGTDMWETIATGAPSPHKDLLINTMRDKSALRSGTWKLVLHHTEPGDGHQVDQADQADRVELYDLASDPIERHDVAASNPRVVQDLRARLEAYREQSVESIYTSR